MQPLGVTLTTASALFVGTNLDDMVWCSPCSTFRREPMGVPKTWQIWTGQYVGVSVLVGVSLLAAFGLTLLPDNRAWLLGLVPLGLGVYKLWASLRARRSSERPSPAVATGLGGVIAVTVANGGDNIAAYTPIFRTSTPSEIVVMTGVFALGVALWCYAGSWLVAHRRVTEGIHRWGHWTIPGVFIAIGVYIFYKGGVLGF